MLRISEMETGNGHVTLKLEGRIVGPWVAELERACGILTERRQAFGLDLTDVFFVDRGGVALLLDLKQRRIVLQGCSPFVMAELSEAERETGTAET
jgi:ABC-type transporter Mla MlaB component